MRFLIPAIYVVSARRGSNDVNVVSRRGSGAQPLEGFSFVISRGDARMIPVIIADIKTAVDRWEEDSLRTDKPFPATKGENIFQRRISDLIGEVKGLSQEVKEGLDEETRTRIVQMQAKAALEMYGEITDWLNVPHSRYIFIPDGVISWSTEFLQVQLGHEASTMCEWRLKRMPGPVSENHFVNRNMDICLFDGLETAGPERFRDGKIHVTVTNGGRMSIECGNVGFFDAHREVLSAALQIQWWRNGSIHSRDRKLWGKIHNAHDYFSLTGEVFDRTRAQTLCARLARGRQIVSEILDSVGPRTQIEYIDERNIPNRDLVSEFLRL
jgi:hypothetical protein